MFTEHQLQRPLGLGKPPSSSSNLNPLSCVSCRRRKLKCDRSLDGCLRCFKSGVECCYPNRLPSYAARRNPPILARASGITNHNTQPNSRTSPGCETSPSAGSDNTKGINRQRLELQSPTEDGKLFCRNGTFSYVSNEFWTKLTDQANDTNILNEEVFGPGPSLNDEGMCLSDRGSESLLFGLPFGVDPQQDRHPPPQICFYFWQTFIERVDPFVRVLHKPTTQTQLVAAMNSTGALPAKTDLLLFTIYFAAITSLTDEECEVDLKISRLSLLKRYKTTVESSLSRVGFLTTKEHEVLQAFVIYMACIRKNGPKNPVLPLKSIAIRLAQTMGIHRDGEEFSLSVFEIEMRRRLWWHLRLLDEQSSEDDGLTPVTHGISFSTKLPTHINDCDLRPETKHFPISRQGWTDMTFFLVRCEILELARRLRKIQAKAKDSQSSKVAFESMSNDLQALTDRVENKYLQYLDLSVPLIWVCISTCRFIITKLHIRTYHLLKEWCRGFSMVHDTREKLLPLAIGSIVTVIKFLADRSLLKWRWTFCNHILIYAVGHLIFELRDQPEGPYTDEARGLLEKVTDPQSEVSAELKKSLPHNALQRLLEKMRIQRHSIHDIDSRLERRQKRGLPTTTHNIEYTESTHIDGLWAGNTSWDTCDDLFPLPRNTGAGTVAFDKGVDNQNNVCNAPEPSMSDFDQAFYTLLGQTPDSFSLESDRNGPSGMTAPANIGALESTLA